MSESESRLETSEEDSGSANNMDNMSCNLMNSSMSPEMAAVFMSKNIQVYIADVLGAMAFGRDDICLAQSFLIVSAYSL
jgi:hypothetical protein